MEDTYGPRDFVGYGPNPPNAQWPNGAKIAISIMLNYEEGSELCPLNGDPTSEWIGSELGPATGPLKGRNTHIESLYEYGGKAGVWRALRLFQEYGIKCSSWMVGQALTINPEVGRALVAAGHEVASHGWRWVDRADWTEQEEIDSIRQCINAIRDICGKPPRGWYYGMVASNIVSRSRALVARVFEEEGLDLKYYSDDYSDDLPFYIPYPGTKEGGKPLMIVPYALDNNDFKDGGHNSFLTPDNFFAYLKASFDELYREGERGAPKMMSIGLHCRIVGRPGRIAGLRKFIEYAQKHEAVWFATREEIADHWREVHPYKP